MRTHSLWIPAAVLLFGGLASAGTVTTITSVNSPTISTFFGNNTTFDSTTSYSNNGATFNASSTVYMYPVVPSNYIADISNPSSSGGSLSISLSALANQFGFDANDTFSGQVNPEIFQIASVEFFSDAAFTTSTDTYSTLTSVGQDSFFGLQDTTAFQSVIINFNACGQSCGGGNFSPYLDDFQVGTASLAPEPASASILLSGLGALAASVLALRRRR